MGGDSNDTNGVVDWPEERANQTDFYFNDHDDHANRKKNIISSSSSPSKYHLTCRSKPNNNRYKGKDSDATKKDDTPSKEQLILYHSETKDIVDIMNADDIIGVELEIKFDYGENSGANDNDDSMHKVGIHNERAKERSEEMAKYEKELGKKLLMKGNMDMGVDMDVDVDADVMSMEGDAFSGGKGGKTCTSAAYLNIYCYPRSIPRPGLVALIKNKCSLHETSSLSSSKINLCDKVTKDDNDDNKYDVHYEDEDDIDEKMLGSRYEKHRRYKLFPTEDFSNVQQLIQAIRKVAKLGHFENSPNARQNDDTIVSSRKHNYLVVVNPFSGTKKGKMVYTTLISKMLQECGVDHDVLFTERPGHALERMKKITASNDHDSNSGSNGGSLDVSEYDAIIAVGGDGILSEIFNGLKSRDDFSAVIQRLKVGIVGCGTCNGLAASILHQANEKYDTLESMFLICKGRTTKLDLSIYQTKNNSYVGFLTMTWAMISDIDIDSECIRFLGVLRNDIWGAWLVLNMRSYRAKFSYLPAESLMDGDNKDSHTKIDEDVPSDWVTIEDEFVLFWASNVSHAAFNVQQSPESKLNDGLIRIYIVRKPISRMQMAGMLIDMGNGKHTSYRGAEFFDCKAFRLTPLCPGSYNVVDGEVVEKTQIQGSIQEETVNIFCT